MDTQQLFQAKKRLNEFLEEHPELKAEQAMIEEALNKAGNQENRLNLAFHLMIEQLRELNEALSYFKGPQN
jgi:hypothetical protein